MHDSGSWQANVVPVKTSVVIALRFRSLGLKGWNSRRGPLHHFADRCITKFSLRNEKFELPPRTKTTFITAFNRDNTILASCHGDHNTHILDVRKKKLIKSLSGHERSPWCVTFHPGSNEILATGSLNGEVRVWDLRGDGSESWTLEPVDETEEQVAIASLSFHPYDNVLAIAGGNEILFWDWSFPKPFASVKTNLSNEKVRLVRFDPWGHSIITGVANMEDEEEEQSFDLPTLISQPSRSWRTGTTDFRPSARIRARHRNLGRDVAASAEPQPTVAVNLSESSERRRLTTRWQARRGHRAERARTREDSSSENVESVSVDGSMQPWAMDTDRDRSDLSATHQRILHARVSVNEEIRQQYTRLQILSQERQRLELRLRELQDSANEVRNSTPLLLDHSLLSSELSSDGSGTSGASQIGAPYATSINTSLRERQRHLLDHMSADRRDYHLAVLRGLQPPSQPLTPSSAQPSNGALASELRVARLQRRSRYQSFCPRLIPRSLTTRVDSEYSQPRIAPYVSFPRLNSVGPLVIERMPQNSTERRQRISAELRRLRADFMRDLRTPNAASSRGSYGTILLPTADTFDQPPSSLRANLPGTSQPYHDRSGMAENSGTRAGFVSVSSLPSSDRDEVVEVPIPDAEVTVTHGEAQPSRSNERFLDFSLPSNSNDFAEQFQHSLPDDIRMPMTADTEEQNLRIPNSNGLTLMEPIPPTDYLLDLDLTRENQFEPDIYPERHLETVAVGEREPAPAPSPHLPSSILTGSNWLVPASVGFGHNRANWLPLVRLHNPATSQPNTTQYDQFGIFPPTYSSLYSTSPTASTASLRAAEGTGGVPANRPLPDFSFIRQSSTAEHQPSSLLESSSESLSSQSRTLDFARAGGAAVGSSMESRPTVTENSSPFAAETISAAVDSLIQATDSLSEAADNLLLEAVASESNLTMQDDSRSSTGTFSPFGADTSLHGSPPSASTRSDMVGPTAHHISMTSRPTPNLARFDMYTAQASSQPRTLAQRPPSTTSVLPSMSELISTSAEFVSGQSRRSVLHPHSSMSGIPSVPWPISTSAEFVNSQPRTLVLRPRSVAPVPSASRSTSTSTQFAGSQRHRSLLRPLSTASMMPPASQSNSASAEFVTNEPRTLSSVLPSLSQPTRSQSASDSLHRPLSGVTTQMSSHPSAASESTDAGTSSSSWRQFRHVQLPGMHLNSRYWTADGTLHSIDRPISQRVRVAEEDASNQPNADSAENLLGVLPTWNGPPRMWGETMLRVRANSRSPFGPSRLQSRSQRQIRRTRNAMRMSINRIISTVYAENSGHRAVVLNIDSATYRIQYWDFTRLALPEISRSDINVLVPHCKIYNDASVDISLDGRLLAVFVPASVGHPDNMMNVGVFSLDPAMFGQLLFKKSFGPNAVCLSISPLCNHICVGLRNRQFLLSEARPNRFLMAQVLELSSENSSEMPVVKSVYHPAPENQSRQGSINTIAWSPEVGGGLVYGTNSGDLRMCSVDPGQKEE